LRGLSDDADGVTPDCRIETKLDAKALRGNACSAFAARGFGR